MPVFEGPDAARRASLFAATLLAQALRQALRRRGRVVLAVPGGRSPTEVFRALAGRPLAWARCDVVVTDERRVGAADPRRNDRLVRRGLLRGPAARARLHGIADRAGRPRRPALPARPDVCLLAMGDDGHVASLFAHTAWRRPDDLIVARAPAVPQARISWNYRWLAGAGTLVVLVFGAGKADLFRRRPPSGAPLPVHRLLALAGPTAQVVVAVP